MRSTFLERLLIKRAGRISLTLSINLKSSNQAGNLSGVLREASTTSNDGMSVFSWGPDGLIHSIHPRKSIEIFTLGIRVEFGSPESIEVKVYMHDRRHKLRPGHRLFRASRTCYAITESSTAEVAVIGWALLLGRDLASFEYEAVANLNLHNRQGRTKLYAEKHPCLSENQVLVLQSTEIAVANDKRTF